MVDFLEKMPSKWLFVTGLFFLVSGIMAVLSGNVLYIIAGIGSILTGVQNFIDSQHLKKTAS